MAKQRSIVLTDPQAEWLSGEAARLGITVADLIRRIVDGARMADLGRRAVGHGLLPASAFTDA